MKGNVSKGPVLLHYSLLALFPLTKSHKTAESRSKLEIKIQLNIPLNFKFLSDSVFPFFFFFLMPFTFDLVVDFIVDAACMGLRSCPFSEVTWQMLCNACMDKPCLCQALHIIVNPIMAAPQASSVGENIPKMKMASKKAINYSFTYL